MMLPASHQSSPIILFCIFSCLIESYAGRHLIDQLLGLHSTPLHKCFFKLCRFSSQYNALY